MDKDTPLFKKTSFSDLLGEIYSNQKKKDRQLNLLIAELKPLIKNISDATIIVPLIKEYMEIGVKNDEHIVKMAAIIQRLLATETKATIAGGEHLLISEEEKEQILRDLDSIQNELDLDEELNIDSELDKAKEQLEEKIGNKS